MAREIDLLLLAAGFGTRLRPLTDELPKALLPIYGVPILDLQIASFLHAHGDHSLRIRQVIVNGHHLAESVRAHLDAHPDRDRIVFSHEEEILGTGGAIARAASWLQTDPFLVCNADAFFRPPIAEALAAHRGGGREVTLVLVDLPIRPNVRVSEGNVLGISRDPGARDGLTFTGFQVVSPRFLERLPAVGFADVRDAYDEAAREGAVGAAIWRPEPPVPFVDIGTPRAYLDAHRMAAGPLGRRFGLPDPLPAGIEPADGYGFVDATARVGHGARIEESIVLANAAVGAGSAVRGSIIGPGRAVEGEIVDRLATRIGERRIEG